MSASRICDTSVFSIAPALRRASVLNGSTGLYLLLELGLLTVVLCLVMRFTASGGSGSVARLLGVGAMKLMDSGQVISKISRNDDSKGLRVQ